jgi:hypothetical protein
MQRKCNWCTNDIGKLRRPSKNKPKSGICKKCEDDTIKKLNGRGTPIKNLAFVTSGRTTELVIRISGRK